MGVINAVALAAAAAVYFAASVDAHGWVQQPLARQFCNGDEVKWATTVAAGNGARDMKPPYGGVPGLCGDPFGGKQDTGDSNFVGMPCDPQETYEEGGILSLQIDISANHGGFFELSVCDSKAISQECFDRNKMTTVEHGIEQWHISYQAVQDPDDKRPETYIMEWKLPEGVTCEHCVLQWSWWTAHHCLFPCEEEVCGFYAKKRNNIIRPSATWDMPMCETKYPEVGQQPQIFRNCVDIKIVPSEDPTPPEAGKEESVTAPSPAPEPVEPAKDPEATLPPTGEAPPPMAPPTTETSVTTEPTIEPTQPPSTENTPAGTSENSFYNHPFFAFLAQYGLTPSNSVPSSIPPKSPPTTSSPPQQAVFTEQDSCTMSRRFLLEQEVLEEEDSVHDISGAGNIMDCGELVVDQVLIEVNKKRKEKKAQALECSNRAVGVAENFAEIMSNQGHELYESADNCNLAKFRGRCAQMVAVGAPGAPFTTLPGVDHAVLLDPMYAVAGVGYYEADGITYWTMLLG